MLLVDVYNVLHITGVLPPELAGLDVAELGDLIGVSRYRSGKTLLVCDGFGAPTVDDKEACAYLSGREPNARDYAGILFAGRGREADSLIERLLERFGGSRRVTVISSDHRLKRAAKRAKARHVRSEDFLRDLAEDARRTPRAPRAARPKGLGDDTQLSKDEVDLWARRFGLTPDDPLMSIPAREALPPPPPPASRPGSKPAAKLPPPAPAAPPAPIDPLLLEALRMWPGRISLEDFDMELWLGQDDLMGDPEIRKFT
ncbi:MAG: NYN domain-containing protein [Phycisphaerales bacterium]